MHQLFKKINLTHLKYFFDATQLESISQSAKKNFVTQSTITQAIKKIEEALDCKLINHKRNKFQLTAQGIFIVKHLQTLLQSCQNFVENVVVDKEISGLLRISAPGGLSSTFLQKYLQEFSKIYPRISIDVQIYMPDVILEKISYGSVELGILLQNMDLSKFQAYSIYSGFFKAYRNKKASGKVENDKIILSGKNIPENIKFINYYENRFNKSIPIAITLPTWLGIANYVKESMGIGFFPDYLYNFSNYNKNLVSVFDDFPDIPYEIMLVRSQTDSLSPVANAFYQFLTKSNI